MSDRPSLSVSTPLDRLVVSHADRRSWNDGDQATLERAKGAVMLRYGVNSHVALAVLANWSRTADVSIATLASTLVDGTVRNSEPPFDRATLDDWLEERLNEDG